MCGEHAHDVHRNLKHPGSSPHVRGAHRRLDQRHLRRGIIPACAGSTNGSYVVGQDAAGSSPHVRGAQNARASPAAVVGIIPACAGSTWVNLAFDNHFRDHPRMCGEHAGGMSTCIAGRGSSPHVRGALEQD